MEFGSFVARQDQGLACSARLVIVNNLASEPRLVNSRVWGSGRDGESDGDREDQQGQSGYDGDVTKLKAKETRRRLWETLYQSELRQEANYERRNKEYET